MAFAAGNMCVMCDEAITNPVCPACLQEGVQQWLLEQGQDELVEDVQELTRCVSAGNSVSREQRKLAFRAAFARFANRGDAFCIKCDNLMSLCAYCYTKEVFNLIKEQPHLVERYLDYFNYDLEHLGWEQDARAYIN